MNNKNILTENYPQIIENMVDGLFTVDTNRIITSWNKAAESILGYKRAEVLGKPCDFFKSPTCMGALRNNKGICPLFSEEKIVRKRCIIRGKNGKDKNVLKNAQLLRNQQGKIIGGVETIIDITELTEREHEVDLLKQELRGRKCLDQIVGNHHTMQNIYSLIDLAKESDAPVLICGERGTGKELVARTIHYTGCRKNRPFIKVNCSLFSETFLERDLLGQNNHSAGAPTSKDMGKLAKAGLGSIFLEEIADIPLPLQKRLAKILKEKKITSRGNICSYKLNVRIIVGTTKDIPRLVEEGEFSKELFEQINAITITIPSLRERKIDIPLLVDHFIKRLTNQGEKCIVKCDQKTIDMLMKYNWCGNIRELENTIEYAYVTCRTDTIRAHNIPQHIKQGLMIEGIVADNESSYAKERIQILRALEMAQGNKTKAAVLLGYSRVTLWKKMKKLSIETE